jgi:hypothetical protein
MLLLKLALAPSLVAGVTLAGRRWGARVAGVLAGLPVVGGPILLLVALEQGPSFAARTATGTLVGLVSTIAFCLTHAWSARRLRWPAALALGWLTVVVATWLLGHLTLGVGGALALVVFALTGAIAVMPPPAMATPRLRAPWWDLPVRMLATAALVLAVTTSARLLGPRWTGLLTPFPIATSVLAVFAHAQTGSPARLLRGLMSGLYGFVGFVIVIAATVERWGLWPTFAVGVALAIAVNTLLLTLASRRT